MKVCVQVDLTVRPSRRHLDEMRLAAMLMTDDKTSVSISIVKNQNALLAEFTMPKARQIDVVERIGKAFSRDMPDYNTQTLSFPKKERNIKKSS